MNITEKIINSRQIFVGLKVLKDWNRYLLSHNLDFFLL